MEGISDRVHANTTPNPIAIQNRLTTIVMLYAFAIRYCRCAKVKKAGGSDNSRGVSPVFGQPTLVVSTKDDFFNHWNECITHDCRQQPELPSSPRHLKESLTPRCHSAQWMNGVYQAVNQHWPLRQERGSDTSEYQSLPRK